MQKRIVIADDDPTMRAALGEVLHSAGYVATLYPSGDEAEGHLKQSGADLVVSDVRMPGLGGLELLKRFPHIPFIMISGFATVPEAVEAMKIGLREELMVFLGNANGRRVVVVGIGSPMRRDDFVGLRIIELLSGKTPENVLLLPTETVPESYTGSIRSFEPSHVILLDAANFGGTPGEARIIPPNAIAKTSVSTHSLPLNVFIGYVKETICDKVLLVGIQGTNIEMGEGLTPSVEKGAKELAKMLEELLAK